MTGGRQERDPGAFGKRDGTPQARIDRAHEGIVRDEVKGIAFTRQSELHRVAFAFDFNGTGRGFHVTSSIVDLSGLMQRGDPAETLIRSQVELPLNDSLFPNAALTQGRKSPAFSVDFDLNFDPDIVLKIENPTVRPTTLEPVVLDFRDAQLMTVGVQKVPLLSHALSLGQHLAQREGDEVSEIESLKFFSLLQKNMKKITGEVLNLYCIQHSIPVIRSYQNPDMTDPEYTTEGEVEGSVLQVHAADPLIELRSAVNGANIVTSINNMRSEKTTPVPYPIHDLQAVTEELNRFSHEGIRAKRIEKEKVMREIRRLSSSRITSMRPRDIYNFAKRALANGVTPHDNEMETFYNEFFIRMREGSISSGAYYRALFAADNSNGEYDTVRETAIEGLYRNPSIATDVLDMVVKNTNSQGQMQTAEREADTGRVYDAFVTVTVDDETVSSDAFSSTNPQMSEQLAIANVLSKMSGISTERDSTLQNEAEIDATTLQENEKSRIRSEGQTKQLPQNVP